jgi:aryl-alcohol dehydrogenase (NADP+)
MMQTEWRPESLQIAQEIKRRAEARGTSAGKFAVAWVLNNRFVTAVIGGPRTEEQWDDYVDALSFEFSAEDEAFVDGLVTTGHPSTPGYNDPAYPMLGTMVASTGSHHGPASAEMRRCSIPCVSRGEGSRTVRRTRPHRSQKQYRSS